MSVKFGKGPLKRIIAIFVILAAAFAPAAAEPFTLEGVRAEVKRDYGSVAHEGTEALAALLAGRNPPLLFDVRQRQEYAVSRIPGAVRVDPDVRVAEFLKKYAGAAEDRTVVFYCAVGVRSSQLAERVQAGLKAAGARAVYNLDGGIFAWHKENRPLADDKGETPYVHPFDRYWGRLVARPELARTAPRP